MRGPGSRLPSCWPACREPSCAFAFGRGEEPRPGPRGAGTVCSRLWGGRQRTRTGAHTRPERETKRLRKKTARDPVRMRARVRRHRESPEKALGAQVWTGRPLELCGCPGQDRHETAKEGEGQRWVQERATEGARMGTIGRAGDKPEARRRPRGRHTEQVTEAPAPSPGGLLRVLSFPGGARSVSRNGERQTVGPRDTPLSAARSPLALCPPRPLPSSLPPTHAQGESWGGRSDTVGQEHKGTVAPTSAMTRPPPPRPTSPFLSLGLSFPWSHSPPSFYGPVSLKSPT